MKPWKKDKTTTRSAPIGIDFLVEQGMCAQMNGIDIENFNRSQNRKPVFGTDGLGTCVGLIVVYNDGAVFCGHMDAKSSPRIELEKNSMIANVGNIIDRLVSKQDVKSIKYASTSKDSSTACIEAAIKSRFSGAIKAEGTLIYFDGKDIIVSNENITGGERVGLFSFSA